MDVADSLAAVPPLFPSWDLEGQVLQILRRHQFLRLGVVAQT